MACGMSWSACWARLDPPRYAGKSPATPAMTPRASSAAAAMAPVLPLTARVTRRLGPYEAVLCPYEPTNWPYGAERPPATTMVSPAVSPGGAVFWPNGPGFSLTRTALAPTGGVRRPTGTIAPGASMLANRVHAADQPSGVSGHHSSGCERGPPVIQMP